MNILITGGSSGLGEAVVRKLASENNHQIYFTYANSSEKAHSITNEFSNVKAIKCDFRIADDINSLCQQLNEFSIDVLINNAYFGEPVKTYFHKIAINEFKNDFEYNVLPVIALTQAAIHVFRKKKSGKIITILTSFLMNTPPLGTASYVSNKAYLSQLSKVWATENIKFNISSNTVSPSFMQTNFTDTTDDRIIEQMIADHPLKSILKTEEVAEAVSFLVKSSNQINGIDLPVNAGANLK
jgi:NAD(P)-dependent dehydrogenase (short-subunit alcohol dehydrogenase family)